MRRANVYTVGAALISAGALLVSCKRSSLTKSVAQNSADFTPNPAHETRGTPTVH